MSEPNIAVIANDVVPGSEMPVAAPGLRALGLAQGLHAHGFRVETVVVSRQVEKQWQAEISPPTQPGTVVLPADRLTDYLRSRRPVFAIITNSNQIDRIGEIDEVRIILDLFAPKVLELVYRDQDLSADAVLGLSARKIRAIQRADAFIVNGSKKVPYFLAWILQAGIDVRKIDIGIVPMAVPAMFEEKRPGRPISLVNAGYLQGWSRHGAWVEVIRRLLDEGGLQLHVLTPEHWGSAASPGPSHAIEELRAHPAVSSYSSLRFNEFQAFLAQADVSIDLFDWSWEREYAMVTRTVVALACGVPVIHPPFTEVSPIIADYDAGWLVDPGDGAALEGILKGLIDDPSEIHGKSANTRRAWKETFEPAVAAADLVQIIRKLERR